MSASKVAKAAAERQLLQAQAEEDRAWEMYEADSGPEPGPTPGARALTRASEKRFRAELDLARLGGSAVIA